jgi:molybdopterin-guanine dinucleotide biosynthesis protein A
MTITGIVLAGGKGRRMGGIDKGLAVFQGKPLIAHVLERFSPQVDELLINANRSIESYQPWGCTLIHDAFPDFAGPLAGLHAGLLHAQHPLVATVPCDAPFLPLDLVDRLHAALLEQHADIAIARTHTRIQPVFSLCRSLLLPNLSTFLSSGGRKVEAWHAGLNKVEVDFDDKAAAFANINTLEELACQL